MDKVFICHSSNDKVFVRKLANELERHDIDIWLDEREIKVGDSLIETIQEAIKGSSYVIVVLSASSVNKPWVKLELTAALSLEILEKQKRILPILINECKIPLFLLDKKYADFSTSFESGLNDLLNTILPFSELTSRNFDYEYSSIELELLTPNGSLAIMTKRNLHRCIVDKADIIIEEFRVDGNVTDLEVDYGTIKDIQYEVGHIIVECQLPKTLNRGETFEKTLKAKLINTFLGEHEYWSGFGSFPGKSFSLKIIFPKERVPKTWYITEKIGSQLIKSKNSIASNILNDKMELSFCIENPKLNAELTLHWFW